jgi:hypothetical protein
MAKQVFGFQLWMGKQKKGKIFCSDPSGGRQPGNSPARYTALSLPQIKQQGRQDKKRGKQRTKQKDEQEAKRSEKKYRQCRLFTSHFIRWLVYTE